MYSKLHLYLIGSIVNMYRNGKLSVLRTLLIRVELCGFIFHWNTHWTFNIYKHKVNNDESFSKSNHPTFKKNNLYQFMKLLKFLWVLDKWSLIYKIVFY